MRVVPWSGEQQRTTLAERCVACELMRNGSRTFVARRVLLTEPRVDGQCEHRVTSGASFQRRASKVRGREEVISEMPKKKKATKKKKH
jgi:hypothetical protein